MKIIAPILTASLFIISCKKNNLNTTTPPISHTGLVKSITHKAHKLDSSGQFSIWVDSFLYDNQNRVSDYFRISRDTSFILDTGGHPIPANLNSLVERNSLAYDGDNVFPGNMTFDGKGYSLNYNSANQFISLTGLPTAPQVSYSYFDGLIVGFTNFQNNTYSVDSISMDANENVTSVILGGNFSVDSSYDRIALYHYSYSNIANPIHKNKSAAFALFLATGFIQSNNINDRLEWITYGQNSTIVRDEVSTFQNIVDANHLIQSSFCPENGDLTRWSYY